MTSIDDVVDAWLASSSDAFFVIKEQFGLADSWTFSIASPDVVPQDLQEQVLDDLSGAAAFMLRRLQALRYLLKEQPWSDLEKPAVRMIAAYISDVHVFLWNIQDRGLVPRDRLPVIERARGLTEQLASGAAQKLAAS